jgi:hypothetical protein
MSLHRLKYKLVQRYRREVPHNQPMRSRNGWWVYIQAYRDALNAAWPRASFYWKIGAATDLQHRTRKFGWADDTVQAFLAGVLGR